MKNIFYPALVRGKSIAIALAALAFALSFFLFAASKNAAMLVPSAHAAQVDYFLKLADIPGESLDSTHKDWIDIMSWSWGLSNPSASSATGGAGAGKVRFHDLVITKLVDKASPQLLLACASGKHIKTAKVVARKAGGEHDYLIYTFQNLLCSSDKISGSGTNFPTEEITLNFSQVHVEYHQQNADGKLGSAIGGGWDIVKNQPLLLSTASPTDILSPAAENATDTTNAQ